MNFLDATVKVNGKDVTLQVGNYSLKLPENKAKALIDGGYDGKTVVMGIRPEDFCLRQNSRASFRRKLGESAICSKYEQNSTASLSVAYLFFIIYSKSTVGQLTKLNFFLCINRYIPIHPISNHTDNNKQHHISSSKHF